MGKLNGSFGSAPIVSSGARPVPPCFLEVEGNVLQKCSSVAWVGACAAAGIANRRATGFSAYPQAAAWLLFKC